MTSLPTDQRTAYEQLKEFRQTGRIQNDSTLINFPNKPQHCPHNNYRCVVCTDERDVIECSGCGRQIETSCNFDEEYS